MSKPILIAFTLLKVSENEYARRTRIGVAWPHPEDDRFTVELDAMPLDGRFILVPQDETDGTP
jgi:hypothetical protein